MTARTHDLAAVSLLGIVVVSSASTATYSLSTLLIALLANQIGGILPDIDQPTAPLWRNVSLAKFAGKIFGKMSGGHRFLTHSLIGVVLAWYLAGMLLLFLSPLMPGVDTDLVQKAFIVGVLSHLIMDSLTKEGVPWLLPIPIKFGIPPVKHLRIVTGKWGEKVLFLILLAFDFWYFSAHYSEIARLLHRV